MKKKNHSRYSQRPVPALVYVMGIWFGVGECSIHFSIHFPRALAAVSVSHPPLAWDMPGNSLGVQHPSWEPCARSGPGTVRIYQGQHKEVSEISNWLLFVYWHNSFFLKLRCFCIHLFIPWNYVFFLFFEPLLLLEQIEGSMKKQLKGPSLGQIDPASEWNLWLPPLRK